MRSLPPSSWRVFLLKAMIITIPFQGITVMIPQLRLPILIFFTYLFISIFFWGRQFNFSYTYKPLFLLIALFGIITTVSFLDVTPYSGSGYSFLYQFPLMVIFFHFFSKELINNSIQIKQVMQLFIIGITILILLYFLNINVTEREDDRLSVAGVSPNLVAIYSNIAVLFIINLLHKHHLSKFIRSYYFILVPPLLYITILSGSRGGFLGLVLAIFIYFYFSSRDAIRRFNYIVLGVVLIIGLSFIFLSNDLLYSRFFGSEASLTDSRLPLWKDAFSTVKDNLIFGIGMFRYEQNIIWIRGIFQVTHNEYLSILIYSGLAGLSLFLLFLLLCWKSAYKVYKRYENPLFLSLLVMILFILLKGGGSLLKLFTWFILALVFSSPYIYQNQNDKRDI